MRPIFSPLVLAAASALLAAPAAAQDPAPPSIETLSAEDLAALPVLRIDPAPLATVDPAALGIEGEVRLHSARLLSDGGVAFVDFPTRQFVVTHPDGTLRAMVPVEIGAREGRPSQLRVLDGDRLAFVTTYSAELVVLSAEGQRLETRTLPTSLEAVRLLGLLPDGSAVISGRVPVHPAPGERYVEFDRQRVEIVPPHGGEAVTWATWESRGSIRARGEGLSMVAGNGNLPTRAAHLAGHRLVLSDDAPIVIQSLLPDGSLAYASSALVLPPPARPESVERWIERLDARLAERAPGALPEERLQALAAAALEEGIERLFNLRASASDGTLWAGAFQTRDDWLPHRRAWLVIDATGSLSAWFVPERDGLSNVVDARGDLLLLRKGGPSGGVLQVHRIVR
jgi:hypothetical protein